MSVPDCKIIPDYPFRILNKKWLRVLNLNHKIKHKILINQLIMCLNLMAALAFFREITVDH